MKFHLTTADNHQLITGFGVDEDTNFFVAINNIKYKQTVIVTTNQIITEHEMTQFDALTADNFVALLSLHPEVTLLGTGEKHRFIDPKLIAALTAKHIPVECMTTAAACRTFNILVSEGRNVVAVLLV